METVKGFRLIMRLDKREIFHGMYLTEIEIERFHNYCKTISRYIMELGEVVQVWFNKSLSSEAVYFTIKLHCGDLIHFSIRNHNSKAVHRQFNFFLSDYDRLLNMRLIIIEWVKEQIEQTKEEAHI